MRYPCLSYLELPRFSSLLQSALKGARIDRVFVPECAEHPQEFFKNELVIETRNAQLLVSLRTQACGLAYLPPKTLKPSKKATRSGFDLSLSKTLDGLNISSVQEITGERTLRIAFSKGPELSLFLNLLPALPEGTLVEHQGTQLLSLISSSRNRTEFSIPVERTIEAGIASKIPNRTELTASLDHYSKLWMQVRTTEALHLRQQKLLGRLQQNESAIERKIHSIKQQVEQSRLEPDWNRYGTLLQTHLYSKPKVIAGQFELLDYETGETVKISGDLKLSLQQQLEKYFHLAKRKKKRIEEGSARLQDLNQKSAALHTEIAFLKTTLFEDLESLKKIESKFGFSAESTDKDSLKKLSGYSGKTYRSQEGLVILSGRSKDENFELTFKVARGNDLWLHVKGRPGSHTVILLPPARTASLETLLDAANLCVLHSGGKDWGKTEVDYTQRKFVKKIKGHTEVTYSGNKTLVVSVEQDRIKRLYGES